MATNTIDPPCSVQNEAGVEVSPEVPVLVIEPAKGWVPLKLSELWAYRELLYFLCWREVKVRYKQTALGAAWAIIQPLFTMLVFSLFFGRLAKMPSDGIPYPLFSLTGLVPWTFFANGLSQSSNSLVTNSNLISKVYFPRLAIPLASILAGIVDFGIAFLLLLVMLPFYHVSIPPQVLFLPLFFLLAFVTALGTSLWLSALNVEFRDVRYTIPFLTQFWMFATPIAYPASLLKGPWRIVYGLNPMVGVVEGFRWALLGSTSKPGAIIAASSVAAVLVLVGGAFYFKRMEKTFADIV
jgi:lipopolysaccharide transport system permease protein